MDYLRQLINIDLWNAAIWRGTAFFVEPTGHVPPALGLVFQDGQLGHRIFNDWRTLLGDSDTRDVLRICIIEGEIPGEDPGYTVHIGPDPDSILGTVPEQGPVFDMAPFLMISRLHRMNPEPGSPFLAGHQDGL